MQTATGQQHNNDRNACPERKERKEFGAESDTTLTRERERGRFSRRKWVQLLSLPSRPSTFAFPTTFSGASSKVHQAGAFMGGWV